MIKELSILIPTYNDPCLGLVQTLSRQARQHYGLTWEIVVADDGSTDREVLEQNRRINNIPHCRVVENHQNIGRAAIRNMLAREASYNMLLFIDADMLVPDDNFVRNYAVQTADVVYGGYIVVSPYDSEEPCQLRYRYEKSCVRNHTVQKRKENPYKDFHTSNFLIKRDIFTTHPLDERFISYGYEDVFYGKQLKNAAIGIEHIENPTAFCVFENDEEYVSKTDEAIATLKRFSNELMGYSRLLEIKAMIKRWHLSPIVRILCKPLLPVIRKSLCKGGAPLWLFQLYKVLAICC